MTPTEIRAAAERTLAGMAHRDKEPCQHIFNAHRQCQWCHRMQSDIDAELLARHVKATLTEDDADRIDAGTV